MTLSNQAKVVLAFVVGLLSLAAKQFFGVELAPDLMAVALITPVVSVLSLFGPLKASAIGKAVVAIAIGVVFAILSCKGTADVHPSKIMCGLNGIANGLMACGLWSVAKAGAESAKKAVSPTV